MAKLVGFRDSSTQCWSRVALTSGDPIWISVAQSGLVVKRSRMGLWGAKLYVEANVFNAAMTAKALAHLQDEDLTPVTMTNPVLKAITNAVLHCESAAQVAERLNGAIRRKERAPLAEATSVTPRPTQTPQRQYGPPTFGITQDDGTVLQGGGGRVLPPKTRFCAKCGTKRTVPADVTTAPCQSCGAEIAFPIILYNVGRTEPRTPPKSQREGVLSAEKRAPYRSPIRDLPFDGLVMATLDAMEELGADQGEKESFFASVFGVRRALLAWKYHDVRPHDILADSASENPIWRQLRLSAEEVLERWLEAEVQELVWSTDNPLAATGELLGAFVDGTRDRETGSLAAGLGVAFAMTLVRDQAALAERLLENC